MRLLGPWLLVLALGAAAWQLPEAHAASKTAQAKAQKAQAEALNAQAKEAFKNGKFDEAADLFMQVYDLAKMPAAVYNAARAKEQSGKLVEARSLFELYLRIERTESGREDARKRMASIEEQLHQQALEKERLLAEAKAKAEQEQLRAREESERKVREAEQKAKEAEQKAREAQLIAQKEQAAKAEAEARARAEAEARARAEAEKKTKEAELRARDAEARAKQAEAKVQGGGVQQAGASSGMGVKPGDAGLKPETAAGGAVLAAPKVTAGRKAPPPPPEPTGPATLVGGGVFSVGGGASVQQTGENPDIKPDLSYGAAMLGWAGWGTRGRANWWAVVVDARIERWVGFAAPEPAAMPKGWSLGGGIALPRIAGLMVTVNRHNVDLKNGREPFGYTTLGVRMVVAPRTSYVTIGFEGLIASDRAETPLAYLDEFGYGPLARLTLEFGVHVGNAPLSKP